MLSAFSWFCGTPETRARLRSALVGTPLQASPESGVFIVLSVFCFFWGGEGGREGYFSVFCDIPGHVVPLPKYVFSSSGLSWGSCCSFFFFKNSECICFFFFSKIRSAFVFFCSARRPREETPPETLFFLRPQRSRNYRNISSEDLEIFSPPSGTLGTANCAP